MKFAIMFEASPRWGGTDEKDMVENLMPFWMENYFKRENYLVIDNKPVLFVFNQERLEKDCFESALSQKQTFDACRKFAKDYGFDGMIFAVCSYDTDKASHDNLMERGYDFKFGYSAAYIPPCDFYSDEDEIINEQCNLFSERLKSDSTKFIATPSCFSDPTPRFSQRWLDLGYDFRKSSKIWYLSPEKYKELLKRLKELTDKLPNDAWAKRIVMIDNWNEWDEGHFVAPSHKFGYKYLQAIREVFTEQNNLPDYIAPHDQGFSGYNTSWKTPDFKDTCKKMLENKN